MPAGSATDQRNSIELRGIEKRYGDAVALRPLDLDIRDGEFFCLLGPSGCGKTTTLNMIGGFVEPSGGVVRIAGTDVTKLPPNRRPVNTVFQSYALFPHLNVIENVCFGLRMARVPKDEQRTRAREALDLVGLGNVCRASGRPSFPADRPSALRSLARWSTSPACCCSTSRLVRWI